MKQIRGFMKYIILILIIVTFLSCTTTYVTKRFITDRERTYPTTIDSLSTTKSVTYRYDNFIKNCTLSISLVSALQESEQDKINDSLYRLSVMVFNRTELPNKYKFSCSDIEVLFLPDDNPQTITFDLKHTLDAMEYIPQGPTYWQDLYYDSFYIPNQIDSIRMLFDATLIQTSVADTTKQAYDITMYRYESSYKKSKINEFIQGQ